MRRHSCVHCLFADICPETERCQHYTYYDSGERRELFASIEKSRAAFAEEWMRYLFDRNEPEYFLTPPEPFDEYGMEGGEWY